MYIHSFAITLSMNHGVCDLKMLDNDFYNKKYFLKNK